MAPQTRTLPVRLKSALDRWLSAGQISLGASTFGWNIVGTLAALLGVTIITSWILGSYFGVDIAGSLSFRANDGWCTVPAEGAGVHCWGDFSAIRTASFFSDPSDPEAVYPISTRLIRLPFILLAGVFGFQTSLIVYVVLSLGALLVPAVWAVRYVPAALKPVVIVVAGIATPPLLMTWDRGNVLALAVPFLLMALVGLIRNRPWLVVIAIIIASSIKPQFALIGVVFIAMRSWRPALVALGGSVMLVVVSYPLVFGGRWLEEIRSWISAAGAWSSSQALATDVPVNVSIPRLLHAVANSAPFGSTFAAVPDSTYAAASIGFTAIVVVICAIRGRVLPPVVLATVLLALSGLFSTISFAYYWVILLPVFALLFREGSGSWPRAGVLARLVPLALSATVVLGCTPLLVPFPGVALPDLSSLMPVLTTACMVIFIIAASVWALRLPSARPIDPTAEQLENP